MLDTPEKTEEHKPDGLNVLASLLQEIKALKEQVAAHEERFANLTMNIPEATLNAIMARTLHTHAQVLLAATEPTQTEPTPQKAEEDTTSPGD